jgi:hypothetical protein
MSPDPRTEALEAAYSFISQPNVMAHPDGPKGATVLTYRTHQYNQITSQLRRAMGMQS